MRDAMIEMFRFTPLFVALCVAGFVACADDEGSASKRGGNNAGNGAANNGFGNVMNNGGTNGANNDGFVPEEEEEFEFSSPAVIGNSVYVANETLNTVAVIDSRTLQIRTIPVGFRPTRIVGPSEPVEESRVMVLNQGSSSVTVIDPRTRDTTTHDVLLHANSLTSDPSGRYGIAWYDEQTGDDQNVGDLSAVSLVTAEEAHQISVGFKVQRIEFSQDGDRALILSDDGISVLDFKDVDGDQIAIPTPVFPPEHDTFNPEDVEVAIGPLGRWAVGRTSVARAVVLLDLSTGDHHVIDDAVLPEIPTDLDWIAGMNDRVLIMLPQRSHAIVATVPDGLIAASEITPPVPPLGDAGMDAGADAGSDAGTDAGSDMGADAGPDAGSDTGMDAGSDRDFPMIAGVEFLPVAQPGLGAAEVSRDGSKALIFSTLEGRKRAVLLNLDDLSQRGLSFEKDVLGAVSDDGGHTFLVFHAKQPGPLPVDVTPSDPEYIAKSWGVSVIDVASAASRLVLTEQEPGQAILFSSEELSKIYMIFARPQSGTALQPSHRDVLSVDLESFATKTFRVPGLPEGLGSVRGAGQVYVSQQHPQGQLTFVDVLTGHRQTITGYQLNAGID